jgi:ATP-binding cassette, subfamily C, bacterial CydD
MTRGTSRAVDPRLLRHAGAARGYLVVTVCIGLATTALVLVQAGLLARALAGAARGAGLASLPGTMVALLLVLTARAAAAYGSEAMALRAAARVKSQLRRQLAERSIRLGPSWLSGQRRGEITTLAIKGLDALDAYFARYLPQLVLACLVPLAVLARVMSADWISGLVILVTLPLIPVFGVLIGLYTSERTRRQWRLLARLGGHFLDVVEGLPTLKVFGRARAQAELIKRVTGEHRAAAMAGLRVAFLSALVLELAAAAATALVAVEVGLRLLAGHIGYETALLILLLTPEAYLPLRNLGAQFHASAEGMAAADHVLAILDTPLPVPALGTGPSPGPRHASEPDLHSQPIELAGVTLAYPGRARPALDDVSVSIAPGERIVVTGPSGAGKSSLLALLLRFTEPASGRIQAGGRDLGSIPLSSWRRQIAWVPQSPYLFAGTVADNIALGNPDATRAEIRRAARLAGAEEFITALADGFDTTLAERALSLSAGQRQRIALARAFLRDAPLVLLDEPTAHLDQATARQILADVETLTAGRTVLLVSHREYGPIRPTRVLRLNQGRMVREEARFALAGQPGAGAAVAP